MSNIPDISDLLGIRFKDKGRDKSGFDCFGLLLEVRKRFGRSLEEFSEYEKSDEKTFISNYLNFVTNNNLKEKTCLEPGDCLVFSNGGGNFVHCGVYLNDGRFIHCDAHGVHVQDLDTYFRREYKIYD